LSQASGSSAFEFAKLFVTSSLQDQLTNISPWFVEMSSFVSGYDFIGFTSQMTPES
jgi:hypothetical protein